MTVRRVSGAALLLAAGYAITGALFWGLLNVPESNVPALGLSAALAIMVVAAAGLTTALGTAAAAGAGPRPATPKVMLTGLLAFIAGLAVFGILWWGSGAAGAWWRMHQGEIDAAIISRTGITQTAVLHHAVYWGLWLVRWVLGLSIVAGFVAAAVRGARVLRDGLRLSVRPIPLLAAGAAAIFMSQGVWRIVYWAPERLPPNWMEVAFVAAKLSLLYAVATVIVAAVLHLYATRLTQSRGVER